MNRLISLLLLSTQKTVRKHFFFFFKIFCHSVTAALYSIKLSVMFLWRFLRTAKMMHSQKLHIFCTSNHYLEPDYILLQFSLHESRESGRDKGEYIRWSQKKAPWVRERIYLFSCIPLRQAVHSKSLWPLSGDTFKATLIHPFIIQHYTTTYMCMILNFLFDLFYSKWNHIKCKKKNTKKKNGQSVTLWAWFIFFQFGVDTYLILTRVLRRMPFLTLQFHQGLGVAPRVKPSVNGWFPAQESNPDRGVESVGLVHFFKIYYSDYVQG